MKFLIHLFSIYLFVSSVFIHGDENIELLAQKFPAVIANYSSLVTTLHLKKVVWSRTDIIEALAISKLTCKENQLFYNNTLLEFLSTEKSGEKYADSNLQKNKSPGVIYKWDIEVVNTGLYLLKIRAGLGTYGFLNNNKVMVISDGIITKKNSGSQWVQLTKGKNTLYLILAPRTSNYLSINSDSDISLIKNEIVKLVNSDKKVDTEWVTADFIPYLGTQKNGIYPFIIKEIARIHKMRPFIKNNASMNLLKSFVTQANRENYEVEKYIYLTFPEIYFHFSNASSDSKNPVLNSFILNQNRPRLDFLQQLIYDGQKELGEKFFSQCEESIANINDYPGKDKFISDLYSQRFNSFFRIGRIREANEILKSTQEKNVPFSLPNYIELRPDQEDTVTLTESFNESAAFQIKEAIDVYEGSPDQQVALYKTFLSLSNALVKRNDGAVSLYYYFLINKNANEKLKKDFAVLCREKIQSKIEKAKETRNIKLLEEIIEQYDVIIPLPEMHLILMEEYFNNGAFLKALSQAHLIYERFPDLQAKIIPKMIILENISDLTLEQRKKIPEKFLKAEVKILGKPVAIENLNNASVPAEKSSGSIGKFLKSIPLKSTHSQYWNHAQIPDYQPIEPIFTRSNIIFNGGSYLINFGLEKNEVEWNYHSEAEYKKDHETGNFQKRFITFHSGNQLFTFTNRNFSRQKTVKCFDLKGNMLWDMSDQSISLIEEPICTPIESQGKLFGLSYSNRETINTVSYSVYDSSTGKLILRTPISYIPGSARDIYCRRDTSNWNTFTHDNHFTKDDSFVYGYSGTGIIFKADANTGNLLWEKGFQKPSLTGGNDFWNTHGSAPSGYINTYGNTLVSFMPDIQIFTALNKITGEYIWKSNPDWPRYIHDRGKSDALYFSSANINCEPIIYKINPHNGETLWQTTTNGIMINGEGDTLGNKLYIPAENSILEYNTLTGQLLNIIELNIQPLKIRCNKDYSVILTANSAFIFKNDGDFKSNLVKESGPSLKVAKTFEPDAPPIETLSFENLNLETTLKIPETTYTSPSPWKKTQLIKTSKPYHFLLKCLDNLTLFREGYFMKSGLYIPPEIIWFGQYPWYDIYEDTLYVSENGRITASNLFTREIFWVHEHERVYPAIRKSWNKAPPVIAVTNQYIAYQNENQSIVVLDRKTRNLVIEFYSPSIRIIRMGGDCIVTSNGNGPVRCYDISQNGNEIWSQTYDHFGDLFIEKDMLVFVRTNSGLIGFYDLKTGTLKVQAKGPSPYIMNRYKLDESILYAYGKLYDSKTGNPLLKYQSGTAVVGGGFIGFFKMHGQEGDYIENGKSYTFKTKGGHSDDNYLFTAIKKGNRITIFSFYYIETFEISNDKLVSVEYSNILTGRYGAHSDQANMDLFVLENSLLEIRLDDMYFFRNFDPEFNYEKIQSFRVENKRNFNWPFSELYPEIEVTEKNWISNYGQKPKRKLSYLAFGDENFAYLKFHLSPKSIKEDNNTLYISADGIIGKISIIWDVENWNNAQCSFNVNEQSESWKEIDIQGNIDLYIKIRITGTFPNQFKSTLPNFNIELRQMTGTQNDGAYRIGGAYNGVTNQLPWLNYTNDEAQTLKDFNLRTSSYENKNNFYPQGEDLVLWLKDRRRLKSVENNIQMLKNMLELNVKSYCSVNILSALLLEEIHHLKTSPSGLNEFSDDFNSKVFGIISQLNKLAVSKGMQKEWIDFALSFWTIEVFPFKFSNKLGYDNFSKPYYSLDIKYGSKIAKRSSFNNKENLLAPLINQPYIEWIVPGLIPHFPQNLDLNLISLGNFATNKTGLGKMMFYSPVEAKEFCTRSGKFSDANFKLLKDDVAPLSTTANRYNFQNQKYECFHPVFDKPLINISITVPNIKSPAILKNTGQTADSIMNALENLPSDNNNGLMMIDNYLTLSGKSDEKELIEIYKKWLENLRYNSNSCYQAINNIWYKNQNRKDVIDFVGRIIKECKLPTASPRKFYLDRRNIFLNSEARSVLGPFFKDLITTPERKFTPLIEYKSEDSTHKFDSVLEKKKGGTIYVASKIILNENEKAFVFVRASVAHPNSSISLWLNGKEIIQNIPFLNYDDNTYYQKITLNKGENIMLMKIVGNDNFDWGNNYSICIGDVYGAPIKEIEMKPVHK